MFLAIDTVFNQCSVAVVTDKLTVLSCDTQTGVRTQAQQILPMIKAALNEANLSLGELDALIFNRGPGAFSGIRINTAVVQALSVAHDIPCIGVSSLKALAQAAFDQHGLEHVYVAIDARMKQVYFAEYLLSNATLPSDSKGKPQDSLKMALQDNQQETFQDKGNKTVVSNVKSCDVINSLKIMRSVTDKHNERLLNYEMSTEQDWALVGNGASLLTLRPEQLLVSDVSLEASTLAKLGMVEYFRSGGVSAEQALPVYLRNNAWKTLKEQGRSV